MAVSARKRVQLAERREMAWDLYKRGRSFRRIGEELDYSKSSAQRDVQHVLAEVAARTVESAAETRALNAARVEDVIAAWYPAAAGKNEESEGLERDAAEVFLKAVDQMAKLLGLYRQEVALMTPVPLQVGVDLSGIDEESLDAIIRNLEAARGAGEG